MQKLLLRPISSFREILSSRDDRAMIRSSFVFSLLTLASFITGCTRWINDFPSSIEFSEWRNHNSSTHNQQDDWYFSLAFHIHFLDTVDDMAGKCEIRNTRREREKASRVNIWTPSGAATGVTNNRYPKPTVEYYNWFIARRYTSDLSARSVHFSFSSSPSPP